MTIRLCGIHSSHNCYITELWLWRAINRPILNLASLFFCNSQRKRLSIFLKESMCLVERLWQHPPKIMGSRKTVAHGVVQLAVICIYMRRIGYDSATVNIFFHIGLTTISFCLSPSWFLVVVFFFVVRFSLNFKPPFKCCLEIEKCT